jgi:hypothetical protein
MGYDIVGVCRHTVCCVPCYCDHHKCAGTHRACTLPEGFPQGFPPEGVRLLRRPHEAPPLGRGGVGSGRHCSSRHRPAF